MDDSKISKLLDSLSPEEYEATMKILNEVSESGRSNTLNDIYRSDFTEIPVSIDEFIDSSRYAGWYTNNGKDIYPYWRNKLRHIFSDDVNYSEIAITGCLSGDTMIPLLNGKLVSMKELASRDKLDEYVYSYDIDTNRIVEGHLVDAFSTGIKDTYIIILDNGKSIRATSNHKFIDANSKWTSIDNGMSAGTLLLNEHRVVSIDYYGKEEVYDLTVERYHNFELECNIFAHNSIGTGKSHIAVISLAYTLYKLMCLKDPHAYYGIAKGGFIYIVFFNATLTLSQGVAYTKFQSLLRNSPWFLERGQVTGKKYLEYIPNGPIRFTVGSTMEHSIGKDIIAGLLDEVNFVKGANIMMEKSKIMLLYNSVLERINSRFIVRGRVEGKLFLVSSKKSEYDFIESYIRKQQGKPGIYVIDAKLWEVKPRGTYSGKTFRVAVGGSNMPSRIIPDDEPSEAYTRMGYEIIEPPIEFKGRFEMDIQAALMNVAGISISHVTKFITYDNVVKNYMDMHQPFQSNILTIGTKDTLQIRDFFIPELVPPEVYNKPLFLHLDLSLTGDRSGIGCTAAMGYRYQNEYNIETGQVAPTKELVYRQVFVIGIQCPSGAEISFQKIRNFIYYLKNDLRWNIMGLSTDGYQSADMRQMLITMGFDDTSLISMDRTPNGYLTLKSAINEGRVKMYNIDELETELINLEQDNQTGKVDHKPEFSKDMSDAFAGSLYNASLHDGQFPFNLVEGAQTFQDINYVGSSIDYRDRILQNMVPHKYDPNDVDIDLLIDYQAPKASVNVLEEIQKANPNMSLKDAVEDYINNIKNNRENPHQESNSNSSEVSKYNSINKPSRLEDMMRDYADMNDGILLF